MTQLSNNDYRVEVDGLSLNVCLAAYSKVTPYNSGPYLQAVLAYILTDKRTTMFRLRLGLLKCLTLHNNVIN